MIIIKCKKCDKEIETYPSRISRKHFCSRSCRMSFYAKGNKHNEGKTPWNKGIKQLQTTGEKNPRWKGGISKETEKLRHTLEMIIWRRECLLRDNFTCQITGQNGGDLVVHHINSFSDFPELRSDIDNGITITKELHLYFHKTYGYGNNTREQLDEFIIRQPLAGTFWRLV